jgi:hypothetical protein
MRKVTRNIVEAWARGDSLTSGNTSTNGFEIYLHGNEIAHKCVGEVIALTLSGWNTVTTRERLNGILNFYGIKYRFAQRDFEPVLILERDVIEISEFEPVHFDIVTQRLVDAPVVTA